MSAAPPALSARKRLLSTAAIIGTATTFGLTYGLSAPLIAIELAQRGASEALIGSNAAMHAVGVLSIAPVLPRLAVKYGARSLMLAALAVSASVLCSFPLVPNIGLWFPLRLLLGVASEVLFVLSETWTNELALEGTRGRTMAIYTAALSLGFAAGPTLLSYVGAGKSAYFVGAAFAGTATLPLLMPWLTAPAALAPAKTKFTQYLRLAPIAIATTVLNAAVETAGLSFVVLYATGKGWTETQGMQLVSTLMFGAIVLQLPIGWLADRVDPRRLALALAALSALGALIWPWMLRDPLTAYVIVFVWGGLFVGIYTVMLMFVGTRFKGGDLVGIYSVMGLAWGVGALVGPSAAGLAMNSSPSFGLPYAIAAACAVFALFLSVSKSEA